MANAPIEMISKSVVHTSIKTTEIYLDSIEKKNRLKLQDHLSLSYRCISIRRLKFRKNRFQVMIYTLFI
jgi:hypothetical protein